MDEYIAECGNVSIIANNYKKNSIIERIIMCDKVKEVYIISDLKEELEFDNEKVKAYVQGTQDALNLLREIDYESESRKTIVINNLYKFINENEEIKKIILNLFSIGRAKKINLIITNYTEEEIRDILSNTQIQFINKGEGEVERKSMGSFQKEIDKKKSVIIGDPKGDRIKR